jgi:regulator of RNase E activity RraB
MSNEKEELTNMLNAMKEAADVFKISDEITEKFNGKDSSVVISVATIVAAKVIFGVTGDKREAFSLLATHFSKAYDMIDMFYDEQEEQAEEATKQ